MRYFGGFFGGYGILPTPLTKPHKSLEAKETEWFEYIHKLGSAKSHNID